MTRRRGLSIVAAPLALAALASGVLVASPASADDPDSGLWYSNAFHIPDVHSSGITGDGVTIAVLDSPVNPDVPTLAGSRLEVREPSFCRDESGTGYLPATSSSLSGTDAALHGTQMASLIAGTGAGYDGQTGVPGVAPGARVLFYTVAFDTGNGDGVSLQCRRDDGGTDGVSPATAKAIDEAVDAGADIISISMGLDPLDELVAAVARAERAGVVVVAGVPNEQFGSIGGTWPADGNGVVAVQSVDATGTPRGTPGSPNGFTYTTVSGPGEGVLTQGLGSWQEQVVTVGTSNATPIVAGFLALVHQKYPEATGNQLIQTLIRNTGATDHELVRDDFLGYGIVSASHMLSVDPTQYPDENPLLQADGLPTPEQIAGDPTASPTPGPDAPAPGTPWALVIGLGVGFVVVIGVVILVIVLAVRRARGRVTP